MELCLLNLLILIVFCVIHTLVCSLRTCHMRLTRNHIFIREIWGKFTSFIFWNFEITREISKFQKSELGKFIPNFPLKHVTTSTNHLIYNTKIYFVIFNFQVSVLVPYSLQSMQCFQMQKRIILSQVYCYSKN